MKVVVAPVRRLRAGRPADHHRRRSVDRRLPRRRSLLRDPQPLPAPGRAAVPGADRAVGAVERARRLPARRRGDAAGLPVARLGVRPRHAASRSWAPASPASRATTSTSSPARTWPDASPAPTSPRRSRSTSRRTTLSSMPSTTPAGRAADRGHRARRQARRRRHPPGAAAELHRRAPRRALPLALRALRRARRQPAADVPARAQPGLPRRLLARGRLPRQRLRPHARAAARRAQGRLRDPHPAARPQLRRRGARVRRARCAARSTSGSARRCSTATSACTARSTSRSRRPSWRSQEIERYAGDPRFVQVLLPTTAEYPLGNRKYWPIYAAAAEAGLPLVVHTGGLEQHCGRGLAVVLPRGARRATPTGWPR